MVNKIIGVFKPKGGMVRGFKIYDNCLCKDENGVL